MDETVAIWSVNPNFPQRYNSATRLGAYFQTSFIAG